MLRVCLNCYGQHTTDSVFQWDQNHTLEITGLKIDNISGVHFCNKTKDTAIVVTPTYSNGALLVPVPNSLVEEPYNIIAYIHINDETSAKTIEVINIPLIKRAKPDDYQFTDNVEVATFEKLEKDIVDFISTMTSDFNEFKAEVTQNQTDFENEFMSEYNERVDSGYFLNPESAESMYKNVEDALVKCEGLKVSTGESHVVADTSAGYVTDFNLEGEVYQVTTSGKNLLNNTATSQTVNGVTFTMLSNGCLVVNGTATADIYFKLASNLQLDAGTYILSGCPSGGSTSSYYLSLFAEGATWKGADGGNGLTFSVAEYSSIANDRVEITIKSGTTINNLEFTPMIRLASVEDATYEPYTNGPTPNPDYPQQIETVGIGYAYTGGLSQGYYSQATGVFTSETEAGRVSSQGYNPCYPGTVLEFAYYSEVSNSYDVFFYNSSYEFIGTERFTSFMVNGKPTKNKVIVPDEAKYYKFTIIEPGVTPDTASEFRVINNGACYVEVVSENKNLYPLDTEPFTLVKSSARTKTLNFTPLKNGTYTVSFKVSNASLKGSTAGLNVVNTAGTYKTITISKNGVVSGTLTDDIRQLYFFIASFESDTATITISDIQIEYGNTATDYVPHKSTSIKIPLNNPLRAIGDVKDEIVRIDGVYGVLRKIATRVFNGSEDGWIYQQYLNLGINRKFISIDNALYDNDRNTALCNRFSYDLYNKANHFFIYLDSSIYFCEDINTRTSIDDWKTWLAENPIEVMYELKEPVFEPFEDQSVFYNIPVYDDATILGTTEYLQPTFTVECPVNRTAGLTSEAITKADEAKALSESTSNNVGTIFYDLDTVKSDITQLRALTTTLRKDQKEIESTVTTLETEVEQIDTLSDLVENINSKLGMMLANADHYRDQVVEIPLYGAYDFTDEGSYWSAYKRTEVALDLSNYYVAGVESAECILPAEVDKDEYIETLPRRFTSQISPFGITSDNSNITVDLSGAESGENVIGVSYQSNLAGISGSPNLYYVRVRVYLKSKYNILGVKSEPI